jgi:hypothetical protein
MLPSQEIAMAIPTKPQSFANHRQFPLVTMGVFLILAANAVVAIVGLFRAPGLGTAWAVVTAAAVALIPMLLRATVVVAQDRIIRLEMRLRLTKVLPADRHEDIAKLSVPQLVGLRFASDAELPALVQECLTQNLGKADAVKLKIKDWQADWLRV